MAFGDVINSWSFKLDGPGNTTSTGVTGATAGNYLLYFMGQYAQNSLQNYPASIENKDRILYWDAVSSRQFPGVAYGGLATGGTEDNIDITTDNVANSSGICLEIEGPFAATPLDGSDIETASAGVLTSTSTTAFDLTPSVDNCVVITCFVSRWQDDVTFNYTDTNGYLSPPAGFSGSTVTDGNDRHLVYSWQNTRPLVASASLVQTTAAQVTGSWSTSIGTGDGEAMLAFAVALAPAVASEFGITDVDGDDTINSGQEGVVVNLTGDISATGKRVQLISGATIVEQTVTAENSTSATFTVDYGGLSPGAATLRVLDPLS